MRTTHSSRYLKGVAETNMKRALLQCKKYYLSEREIKASSAGFTDTNRGAVGKCKKCHQYAVSHDKNQCYSRGVTCSPSSLTSLVFEILLCITLVELYNRGSFLSFIFPNPTPGVCAFWYGCIVLSVATVLDCCSCEISEILQ